MGIRLQQKSMTLNDLERNLLLCCQCYAYFDQMAEARITRFSLLALYFSYLHIKFDDETKANQFEFQV